MARTGRWSDAPIRRWVDARFDTYILQTAKAFRTTEIGTGRETWWPNWAAFWARDENGTVTVAAMPRIARAKGFETI